MKGLWLMVRVAVMVLSTGVVFAIPSPAQNEDNQGGGPNVIPRDSVAYGRTYSEWNAAWEQWAYSIPASTHPLFDTADCTTGQSGPVWFLGGKFCYNSGSCSYTNVVRSCTIPRDKAIYFPIIVGEDSALEESVAENPSTPDAQLINLMRAYEYSGISAFQVSASVDGTPIPRLRQNFRVQSVAFGFSIPIDNYLAAIYPKGYNDFQAGTYFPAIDDGWYVMLAPLSPGYHVLKFAGTNGDFTLSIRYNIYVPK